MTEFEGVVPALSQALTKRGYTKLTPVQNEVLAPELKGVDALVSAQTGSGKTVAFGLALAPTLLGDEERFGRADVPLALAVAPTRELALQVMRELEWLYAETGAKVVSCVGGMDMRTERRNLQHGAHIVVGTPGRLRDHIERGSFDTSALKAVVLDEADEMLDLGFREDLEYILGSAPEDRRTLMFSATVPRSIASLAKRYQRDAVRVTTAAEASQHLDIEYKALTIAPNDRENAIINMLRYVDAKNTIIFCATRATVNHMTSRLNNRGFAVVALSGELSQNERTHALQAMRDGRARVCVATDVAARGIDLPNLDLVIHADIPKGRESLLHRSGRTGRAGRKGTSALIVPHTWRKRTERLLQNAKVEATWGKPPSADEIAQRDRERILEDATLNAELSEEDQVFAKELLEKHGPERIAAAFLHLHRAGQPAAEELLDAGSAPPERERKQRDDFTGGVWFSLPVGRKHNAEPRWLLPMLCRAGNITKRDIGAIKIQQNETHFELAPGCVDKFLEALGPSRKVEKSITVDRLRGATDKPKDAAEKKYVKKRPFGEPRDKDDVVRTHGDKKPRGRKSYKPDGDGAGSDKKPWDKGPKKPKGKKPYKADAAPVKDTPPAKKVPWEKDPRNPKAKKPFKPKAGAGGGGDKKPWDKGPGKAKFKGKKTGGANGAKPGSRPLKRKKLNLKSD